MVVIDGPAGAGKSTVARRLAERLGYALLSSGAIYRAVAWRVARGTALETVLSGTRVDFRGPAQAQRVLVNGQDVTEELYTPRMSELAATLSQRPDVRAYADALQRTQAARGPLVVEGRDAATVVFPHADFKFYLDASLDARTRRRGSELAASGQGADLETVRAAIVARDLADRARVLAPLVRPPDATYVDSSEMTVDEVVEFMAKEVERVCSTRS